MTETESTIRIATIYRRDDFDDFRPLGMDLTRWLRISEALARLGFKVDMVVNTARGLVQRGPNLRQIPFSVADWADYDVVKTLFHRGFESLTQAEGIEHPFVISKLGSVVGPTDNTEGVYFFGEERRTLSEIQGRIDRTSKYVTILTDQSRLLWETQFGNKGNVLMVPTGVDRHVPPPRQNPYKEFDDEKIAVYVGNIYATTQRKVNVLWQQRLNSLGRELRKRSVRLCLVGPGRTDRLDPSLVTYMGSVENDKVWDYHHFADVGIVFAQGQVQHNESSKIYYYLRAGLPVVSEEPVPNNWLIGETKLGLIAAYGDEGGMAERIEDAAHRKWDREEGMGYMVANHSWDARAQVYAELFAAAGMTVQGRLQGLLSPRPR